MDIDVKEIFKIDAIYKKIASAIFERIKQKYSDCKTDLWVVGEFKIENDNVYYDINFLPNIYDVDFQRKRLSVFIHDIELIVNDKEMEFINLEQIEDNCSKMFDKLVNERKLEYERECEERHREYLERVF